MLVKITKATTTQNVDFEGKNSVRSQGRSKDCYD